MTSFNSITSLFQGSHMEVWGFDIRILGGSKHSVRNNTYVHEAPSQLGME